MFACRAREATKLVAHIARLSSKATQEAHLLDYVCVLPMPRLSHQMVDGVVTRLFKKEGDRVLAYDILAEVATETLTEDAYKHGDFAGSVKMLIEAQDEGFVARTLVAEGSRVTVGTPLALIVEEEGQVQHVKGLACSIADVYSTEEPVKLLTWQSYLSKSESTNGGSSGCM
jgi:pyruvate/2-oxoglutarate dehydrogenase complex dihydrolipoamide acyltransferase (E2) component